MVVRVKYINVYKLLREYLAYSKKLNDSYFYLLREVIKDMVLSFELGTKSSYCDNRPNTQTYGRRCINPMPKFGFRKTLRVVTFANDRILVSVIPRIERLREFNSILLSEECLRSWIRGGQGRKEVYILDHCEA